MSFPEEPIIPSDPPPATENIPTAARARRRRAARAAMFPADAEGQAALVASLSRRAYPSLELFLFSLVCGIIIGFGFLINSQAVILLGILVTPLMIPWVGLLLSIYIGSARFLFETLRALLFSWVIVFLAGLLTGVAARLFPHVTRDNVITHARLWGPELLVLALGAVTLVASFARSEDKPFLPSILVAYGFYLPIIASGFGLGAALQGIWVEGLLVFVVHFSLASILGLATLFALKLKPTKTGGAASLGAILFMAAIATYLMYPQIAASVIAPPTPTATATWTVAPTDTATQPPTLTPTLTQTPRPTSTSTNTPPAPDENITETPQSATATATATPTETVIPPSSEPPTPAPTRQTLFGKINAGESGGANLRQTPNGKYILTLLNDTVVEVSNEKRNVNGVEWLRVFAVVREQRVEGWLLASVVEYDGATPSP